jgi:hypothetical protein
MRRRLLFAFAAAVAVAVAAPSAARRGAEPEFSFRTPGDAAYCGMAASSRGFSSFRCVTPNDGFYIQLNGVGTTHPTVSKGYDRSLRGYHDASVDLLAFGRNWFSSDAALIGCQSQSIGLTCKQYYGLSFWLGRFRGYRIFFQPEGYPPTISRLFRTDAVYCGISLDNLEPSAPLFICWRPSDGLQLSLSYQERRATFDRNDATVGFRRPGFPLLGRGNTVAWRCARVGSLFADRCSTTRGVPIFTCMRNNAGLSCRNPKKHGFTVNRDAFELF